MSVSFKTSLYTLYHWSSNMFKFVSNASASVSAAHNVVLKFLCR
jgi:hypothetical protein